MTRLSVVTGWTPDHGLRSFGTSMVSASSDHGLDPMNDLHRSLAVSKLVRLTVIGRRHHLVAAIIEDESPATLFFNSLREDEQSGYLERLRRFADTGTLLVPLQLNDLRAGIREFKMTTRRILFYHADQRAAGLVILTHGFSKRQQLTPRTEIDRALWIRQQIEGQ